MSDTLEKTGSEQRTDQITEPGDHERFSHYVDKHKLTEATVFGLPVEALCGKVWVPSRDGRKFPVCPDCKRIMDEVVASNLPSDPSDRAEEPE